jgi:dihydroneopterin aldolase
MIKQALKIQNYKISVHLGYTLEKQKYTQPVHFSLELRFHQNLDACNTDQLQDAVDYVSLMQIIKQVGQNKPYHLIEHLCYEVLIKISDFLKQKYVHGDLAVHVHKIRVPVENLRNGVVFTCEATL